MTVNDHQKHNRRNANTGHSCCIEGHTIDPNLCTLTMVLMGKHFAYTTGIQQDNLLDTGYSGSLTILLLYMFKGLTDIPANYMIIVDTNSST